MREYLSGAQHAYYNDKSVGTALHTIVSWLEKAKRVKDFAVGSFLDIDLTEAVVTALDDHGIESNLKNPILSVLRVIKTD